MRGDGQVVGSQSPVDAVHDRVLGANRDQLLQTHSVVIILEQHEGMLTRMDIDCTPELVSLGKFQAWDILGVEEKTYCNFGYRYQTTSRYRQSLYRYPVSPE